MKSFFENLKEFWSDFRMDKIGLVGLGILVFCVLVVIFEPIISPYPEAGGKWNDITYWANLPEHAPPEWSNLFASRKATTTNSIKAYDESTFTRDGREGKKFVFSYDYQADIGPRDLAVEGMTNGQYEVSVVFVRPDKRSVAVFNKNINVDHFRFTINNDCRDTAFNWLRTGSGESIANVNQYGAILRPTELLFLTARPGMTKDQLALKGAYRIEMSVLPVTAGAAFTEPRITVIGRVSGILGTDGAKHDILAGLIAGLKWALFIGITIAVSTVLIGVIYGTVMAYFGGVTDAVMNTIWEVFVNIPSLPLLIVMAAVFKLNIWMLMLMLVILGWTGSVKIVRSVALQIKQETFVEAAKALGASHGRIIFKHMLPILVPFSFGIMATGVPGAILTEASLSILGLGDPTIVTWGKILNGAGTGAAANGLWWEIVPPGLCIALIGAAFAFIGFSMDKILQPKLRTR